MIKKGDIVKILAGKDRGKTGKVLEVETKFRSATVENANMLTRHQRPRKAGEKGQKLRVPMPMDISKVMLVCPKCKKSSRVKLMTDDKGKKGRVCKKCEKRI